MAKKLDLSNLALRNNFTFSSEVLGEIEIGNCSFGAYQDLHDGLDDFSTIAPEALLKKLISTIGKKTTENSEKTPISPVESENLTTKDLELFSIKFIENNDWLYHDQENPEHETDPEGTTRIKYKKLDLPQKEDEPNTEYLYRLLCENDRRQTESFKKLLKPFSNMSSNISKLVKSNLGISQRLGRSIYNNENRLEIGTSYNPSYDLKNIKLPENPIHKTNDRLDQVISNIDSLRSLASDSALLIKSLNDTALNMAAEFKESSERDSKHNKIMLFIAVVSLALSALFSFLNYQDSKNKDMENGRFSNLLIEQNEKLDHNLNHLGSSLSQSVDSLLKEQLIISSNLSNLVEVNQKTKNASERIIEELKQLKSEIKSNE